jgi:hypothetical protein
MAFEVDARSVEDRVVRVSDLTSGSSLGYGTWRSPAPAPSAANPYVKSAAADATDLRAAASPGDLAVLKTLLSGTKDADPLADATDGAYSAENLPDALAVRSGSHVTAQFAGGYDVIGYSDAAGSTATFFSTGENGNWAKGVAITYGDAAGAPARDAFTRSAMGYLTEHLTDSQDAAGRWSRPTLDVRV